MRRLAGMLVAAALCTGCLGSVLESDAVPPDRYRLDPPRAEVGGTTIPRAVAVGRPRAAASLDTDRIAVSTPDNGFDHLAGARWADAAPSMLQGLLVSALAADGLFAAAVASPSRVPTDLLLDTELRRFEAVYSDAAAPPRVVVELQATLVDTRRDARIASFTSRGEAEAARNDRRAVVAAFEQATGRVVEDVVRRAQAAAGTGR